MARRTGNEAWWREVEAEMHYYHLSMFAAEAQLFARVVKAARAKKMKHEEIALMVAQMWGVSHGTYYRRLKQARETHCVP